MRRWEGHPPLGELSEMSPDHVPWTSPPQGRDRIPFYQLTDPAAEARGLHAPPASCPQRVVAYPGHLLLSSLVPVGFAAAVSMVTVSREQGPVPRPRVQAMRTGPSGSAALSPSAAEQ